MGNDRSTRETSDLNSDAAGQASAELEDARAQIAELKRSVERYRSVVEHVGWGIAVGSADGATIELVNLAFARMHGYGVDELIGSAISEVFAVESRVTLAENIRTVHEKGHYAWESRNLRKDGSTFPTLIDAAAIKDESGRVIRRIVNVQDITERTQAEEQLRRALSQIDLVMNAVGEGIYGVDLGGRVSFINPEAARLLGYKKEELLGQLQHAVMHHTRADGTPYPLEDCHIYAAFRDGVVRRVGDEVFWRKDGTSFRVEYTSTPMMDESNHRTGAVVVFRDMTERMVAEERLLRAEEANRLFRTLMDSSNDIVEVVDPEAGRFLDVNQRGCEELGYTREEYLSLTVPDVDPDVDAGYFAEVMNGLRREGRSRHEGRHRRKDGSTFPVDVSISLVCLDREYVVAIVRDVTDSKAADAGRLLLTTAIEQADEAVVITDTAGTIEYANPACEALTGYSRAELLGHNPRILNSGVQGEALYRALWETIASGKVWRGRLVNKRKDGTLHTLDGTISPVRNAQGDITNYVAVRRDMTATLALEAQFRQAQKMEAVGRLAGGVAHDFNNMLSVVLSYTGLILSDLKSDDPLRADIEEIQKAGQRAADLTRQLLTFSRQQVVLPKVIDLNQIIAGMDRLVGRLLGADVEVTLLPAARLGKVKADPGQIEQIVMNLAVNARDAMLQGGKLTIETANVELDDDYARAHANVSAGSYVMLAVSDTGTGMDAATQTRIFEPFFTTKEKGKGTGLGLATVFGIVAQSGGHIWVYSEPGKGATFKIYFPRTSVAAVVDSSQPPAPEPGRGSETILLVDDDDQVRAVARNILRRNGYVVLEASSGGEAFLICEQHGAKIHLLLTDVIMPRMSGRQLAERLAKLRPEMKVLFMSGYTDDAILQHGIIESDVAFLQKPLTPTSLTSKVWQVLRGGSLSSG